MVVDLYRVFACFEIGNDRGAVKAGRADQISLGNPRPFVVHEDVAFIDFDLALRFGLDAVVSKRRAVVTEARVPYPGAIQVGIVVALNGWQLPDEFRIIALLDKL